MGRTRGLDPELAQWVLTTFPLQTGEVGEKNLWLCLECGAVGRDQAEYE